MKLKCNQIILSSHAQFRLAERAPNIKPYRARSRIQRRITEEQKRGITPDWDGAVQVKFKKFPALWAICYPMLVGGWAVATIFREGWIDDMEECKKYGITAEESSDQTVCEMAVQHYGPEEQTIQALEELSELQQALFKVRRRRESNVPEEIADVRIMLKQLEIIYGCKEEVRQFYIVKLDRLRKKIEGDAS